MTNLNKKHTLGLDISTAVTGWAIIDRADMSLVRSGSVILEHTVGFYAKLDKLISALELVIDREQLGHITVEEAVKAFGGGKSSAQTIALCQSFNGAARALLYREYGLEVDTIPAVSARKLNDIFVPKGENAKVISFQTMLKIYPELPYQIRKGKSGLPREIDLDMTDAIVVARASILRAKSDKSERSE